MGGFCCSLPGIYRRDSMKPVFLAETYTKSTTNLFTRILKVLSPFHLLLYYTMQHVDVASLSGDRERALLVVLAVPSLSLCSAQLSPASGSTVARFGLSYWVSSWQSLPAEAPDCVEPNSLAWFVLGSCATTAQIDQPCYWNCRYPRCLQSV